MPHKQKHLKYIGDAYDNKVLYYLAFNLNGEELHWYPRWSDVDNIMRGAWITEECVNDGKMSTYLALVCLGIITEVVVRDNYNAGHLLKAFEALKQSFYPPNNPPE